MELLLKRGANADHQATDGWSALMMAAHLVRAARMRTRRWMPGSLRAQGHESVVRALIEKGATRDLKNEARFRAAECVACADCGARAQEGETAAALASTPEIAALIETPAS